MQQLSKPVFKASYVHLFNIELYTLISVFTLNIVIAMSCY